MKRRKQKGIPGALHFLDLFVNYVSTYKKNCELYHWLYFVLAAFAIV